MLTVTHGIDSPPIAAIDTCEISPFIANDAGPLPTLILKLPLLQEAEEELIMYQKTFLPFKHEHWFTRDSRGQPVCLVTRITDTLTFLMIRQVTTGEYYEIAHNEWNHSSSWIDRFLLRKSKSRVLKSILRHLGHDLALHECIQLKHPRVKDHLINMDQRLTITKHTVGVVYAGDDQSDFDQMLANNPNNVDSHFWTFLTFLGRPAKAATGLYKETSEPEEEFQGVAYYSKWQQSEFIFHVGPLIPSRPNDPQNIERKKFVGNDIVVLIFRKFKDPPLIKLSTILSKQVHVVIVVTPVGADLSAGFTVQMYRRKIMPEVPEILHPDSKSKLLYPFSSRDIFFSTIMLSELTAYKSTSLSSFFEKPKLNFLEELVEYIR